MIDFRYHLVSLVSVFLALAVGIVLGAGPLKGDLGDTLTRRVNEQRAELNQLNDQLKTTRLAVDNRDTFTRRVIPQLVAGQLTGERVVVVTVPGVDGDAVTTLTEVLRQAGATVTGRVEVQAAWVEPSRAADRDGVVRTLAPSASAAASSAAASSAAASPAGPPTAGASAGSGSTPSTAQAAARQPAAAPTGAPPATAASSTAPSVSGATGTNTALAALLSSAVLTHDATVGGSQPDQGARQLLDALDRAGLVNLDGEPAARAGEAVLLVPAVQTGSDGQAAASPTPAIDPVAQWAALAAALDVAGTGTVVTGPASSATSGGVVAAVRGQDELARGVSTVDTGGTPMGDLATVLALHEQAAGGSGRYGFVGGVDGPMPSRPAAARS